MSICAYCGGSTFADDVCAECYRALEERQREQKAEARAVSDLGENPTLRDAIGMAIVEYYADETGGAGYEGLINFIVASIEKFGPRELVVPSPQPADEYEWGIRFRKEQEAHRDHMTEDEARAWIRDAAEDFLPGVFVLIRRSIGLWQDVEDAALSSLTPNETDLT